MKANDAWNVNEIYVDFESPELSLQSLAVE